MLVLLLDLDLSMGFFKPLWALLIIYQKANVHLTSIKLFMAVWEQRQSPL